jgi:MoaA/NifB/PqqE/SkfB family radical SAM enzyme
MLARFACRMATEVSPRLLFKAGRLWAWKSNRAMRRHRQRLAAGRLFPPFLFLALTSACNLRCRGCWIDSSRPPQWLSLEDVEGILRAGKQQGVSFYTLLGGEPMLYPGLWDLVERHADCYFQLITNGMFFSAENARRLARLGNVTPLVSIDGLAEQNDARRGEGVFAAAMEGLGWLQQEKLLFGVATVVTGANFDEVTSDAYVERFIHAGAMYLWYYVYRPVGAQPSPELCVPREKMLLLRRRLLELRRRHPILVIDTYWNERGEALCPAAAGLGFHIGPRGSIEPCPPLSFACETVRDHERDVFRAIDESQFLRGFQEFVTRRTRGCVILEYPQELAAWMKSQGAADYSGRDAYAELEATPARTSHHLPGEEIPEDYWLYRFLKRQLFFGLGAYG